MSTISPHPHVAKTSSVCIIFANYFNFPVDAPLENLNGLEAWFKFLWVANIGKGRILYYRKTSVRPRARSEAAAYVWACL